MTAPAMVTRSRPAAAIAGRAFRQVRISAAVCGLAFGAVAASSALSYVTTFASAASRHQLIATTSTDRGLSVLLGPVSGVGNVGGYTVYKGFVFLTTIGAIWAILAATRVLRGEEETRRWQLVLAGRTTAARATAATLAAVAAAVGVIVVGTAVLTLLAGRNPDVGFGAADSLLYAVSLAIPVAVFAAVGAVTSQLVRTRRAATGTAMGVFALAFVLRMIGDASASTRWWRWTTPFGWTELVRPFGTNDLVPLLPAVGTVVAFGGAAVLLASRRDAGDGLLATRSVAPLRPRGLGSVLGLSARLEAPVLGAWCAGALVAGVVFGIIARITANQLPASLGDALHGFGVHGSFTNQYLGAAFLFVATIVALLPAGQVGAAAGEESSGRLALLLVQPVRRESWFAGRLLLATATIVVAGALAGLGAWLGARSQGIDLDAVTMIGAGLNVVPTALVALGIGAVVLAIAPRAAAPTVYAVIGWSLVVDILASQVSGVTWLRDVSLFHAMALAPAQDVSVRTVAITLAIAVGLSAVAITVFRRRDVQE
jgi:ABC-2 type transport system permease protein